MRAPKPQVSIFANEGVSPLWSDPDVGHKSREGSAWLRFSDPSALKSSALSVLSKSVDCRGFAAVEADANTVDRQTAERETAMERRADALKTQANVSIRPAALPRSLVASDRRQGGARVPPVCFFWSLASSLPTPIPLHARNHSRRGWCMADCGRRRSLNATATVARRCADDCRTRRSNRRSSRRSPFLNRAEPRQGHRCFDCRRKCSPTFSPKPPCRLHRSKPLSRR